MKLSEMTFEESRNAELQIIPIMEGMINKDEELAKFIDTLSILPIGDERLQILKERMVAVKAAKKKLITNHYDAICSILAILNNSKPADIKKLTRGEADKEISDLLGDLDFLASFASSDSMERVAQSVISLTPEELSRLEQPSTT